jgi:hypothetical protein
MTNIIECKKVLNKKVFFVSKQTTFERAFNMFYSSQSNATEIFNLSMNKIILKK